MKTVAVKYIPWKVSCIPCKFYAWVLPKVTWFGFIVCWWRDPLNMEICPILSWTLQNPGIAMFFNAVNCVLRALQQTCLEHYRTALFRILHTQVLSCHLFAEVKGIERVQECSTLVAFLPRTFLTCLTRLKVSNLQTSNNARWNLIWFSSRKS